MKKIALIFSFIVTTIAFSQEKIEYSDIDSLRSEIRIQAEKKEFTKIVDLINNVSKNDSVYSSLLVTKSYYLMQQKQFQDAINITNEGLNTSDYNNRQAFFLNKAISYWNLNDYQNALKTIDSALIEFPKNAQFYYNKGLIYYDIKDYPNALEMYKMAAILNPFDANIQIKLGNLCYKQHLISQALMCFNIALLLNPEGDNSFNILNSVNNLLSLKNESEKIEAFKISKDDAAFEEIDLVITNKVALNEDYKIDNEINISFTRQNHALLQMLKNFKGNGGFWDAKYVKLYKWIEENGYFNDFIYTTTFSIENPKFKKVIEKKTNDVIKFLPLFKNMWAKINEENELMFNGKKQKVFLNFNNNTFEGLGFKKDDVLVDYWEFYNSDGKLFSKGNFNEKGNRIGEWVWYNLNATINEKANYKDGNLEGANIGFFNNGKINFETNFKNNYLNGSYKLYNTKGALTEHKFFESGKLNGVYQTFYANGNEESIIEYQKDQPAGHMKQFYSNKNLFFEIGFLNGKKNGVEKKYYANKNISSSFNMVNGNFDGAYKAYYKNGALLEEGNGIDGSNTGLWKVYYPTGKLKNEYTFNKGKLEGSYKEYAPEGTLYYDFTYRNDELIAYKFLDKKGVTLKENQKKGGEFLYEGYSIYGIKIAEGNYNVGGGKDGEWKFYTTNGSISSKGVYKNNLAQGEHINYYPNNTIKTKINYINDTIQGYYTYFLENEQLGTQGWYKNGNQDKEWRNYYTNGTLKTINWFHNGNFHGEQKNYSIEGKLYLTQLFEYGDLWLEKYYDQNGNFQYEINYKESHFNLTAKTYHANKKVSTETTFKFGLKNGPFVAYDFYGNKILEGMYLNDKATSKWTYYYASGIKQREITFVNGEITGIVYDYYEDGKINDTYEYILDDRYNTSFSYAEDGITLIGKTQYINNQLHGRKEFYSEEGKLQLIRFYEYDKLIGYSYLNKESQEIPMIPINNETAKIISYFDNGKVAREMEIVNGDYQNTYKSYFYNGQLQAEHFNKNGQYQGKHVVYYSNGKIKEEINYIDDERNGPAKKFYKNGNLKEEVNYINDEKSGIANYFNEAGKLIKTEKYFNNFVYEAKQL